jgi:hypothetical protein
MTDRIAITARERIREATALPVVARFRASGADAAPTTAKYRLDNPDGCEVIGWTDLTPATSISFTIPASANVCRTCLPVERRELIVMADEGLTTQYVERITYEVENIHQIR